MSVPSLAEVLEFESWSPEQKRIAIAGLESEIRAAVVREIQSAGCSKCDDNIRIISQMAEALRGLEGDLERVRRAAARREGV